MKFHSTVQSPLLLGLIGGLSGMVFVFALFFVIASVNAAPTQAPPGGNPTFPLSGATGPQGPQGPQGPAGPSGATNFSCVTRSAAFSSTSSTVGCVGSEISTGGGFYLSDGNNNGLNWNDAWSRPSGNGYECGRNVFSGNNSFCYVRCCTIN